MKPVTWRTAVAVGLTLCLCPTLKAYEQISQRMTADTAMKTPRGHAIIVPDQWRLTRKDNAMLIEAPEGDSHIVIVDVDADSAEAAIAAAWAAYRKPEWELESTENRPDWNGFSQRQRYVYRTAPNERRRVNANAGYTQDGWNVRIFDMADEVSGKRSGQISLLLGSVKARGWSRESFAGKQAHLLSDDKIAELTQFIEQAMQVTGTPGVALGIVQNGEVVYAGGFGVRQLGQPDPVTADSLFMIASNTKSMATLLLAKQVDDEKLTWKTPVVELMPSFRLGNDETTRRTLVEHLICACTGLPRKDMPWVFEFSNRTAADSFRTLANVQPTSDFGALFQYSNSMAAAAGFVAGHVAYPEMELGAAFDKAVQIEIFDPLGMTSTTFDYDKAMSGNFASPHGVTSHGKAVMIPMDFNRSMFHIRPAGGGWSNVRDMLKYIQLEIDEGLLPSGKRLVSREALLERRDAKVSTGNHSHYGMGLEVNDTWGVQVVSHGGAMPGYFSDMLWLPEHNVGAVVLTNGVPGWMIWIDFHRRFLEVLFDGKPRALNDLTAANTIFFDELELSRTQNDSPQNSDAIAALAAQYRHPELGTLGVIRNDSRIYFDTGEFKLEVATRTNTDGTVTFISIDPTWNGLEFQLGDNRALILREAQHEYVFTAD